MTYLILSLSLLSWIICFKLIHNYFLKASTKQIVNENKLIRTPRLEQPLVMMTRSGNLAVVEKYYEGQDYPFYGSIRSNFNNLDMKWSWKLNDKASDTKKHYHDLVAYIGEFE